MSDTRRRFLRQLGVVSSATVLHHTLDAQSAPPAILYDQYGLIVHKGVDGGDTAQREGWYWFGVWIRENTLKDPWTVPRRLKAGDVMKLLEPAGDGVFYRHPKLPPWNNPYDKTYGFSRD